MDDFFRKKLHENNCNYKSALDRIIDKYSKISEQDGDMGVDLATLNNKTLDSYLRRAQAKLNKQIHETQKSLTDESVSALDLTKNSKLDLTYQDNGVDEAEVSTSQSFGDDEMSKSDTTQLTWSSLESGPNITVTELQPEDIDQELEQSLRNQGTSFVELYPSMISRIKKAWHRQNVSEAADSVLRRYHRWRKQANKSNITNTSVALKHTSSKPRKSSSKTLLGGKSPEKRQFKGTESAFRSPFKLSTNLQALQAQHTCPEMKRDTLRRQQHQQVTAMDLSGQSKTSKPKDVSLNQTFNVTSKPKDVSLNQTFTVSELSLLGEQPCTYAASPPQPCYPTAKTSLGQSLRSIRLSLSGSPEQATDCSMYAPEDTPFQHRSDIYSSPVRQSPLKMRMMQSLSRSPHAFYTSPRESPRPRSLSTSLSSPPQKLLRMRLQNTHTPLPSLLQSPKPATAGRLRLQRHLSFDSALPSSHVSHSPKKLDEEIVKLYHKFVCRNKSSPFNGFPCRLCERAPEVSSGGSSALAALALSPHRSILRKRHRDSGCDDHPLSKRSREECCTSSPGSKRYRNELLRRCLSRPEFPHDDLYDSSSKHSMFNKFNSQRPSAQ